MKECSVKLIQAVLILLTLSVAGVFWTVSPTYAQSDRLHDRLVVIKPGQVVIDSLTSVECLHWYFERTVARDSYNKLLVDAEKQAAQIKKKTLIKGLLYGFGAGTITTVLIMAGRK